MTAAAYCKMKLPSKQQMDMNRKLDKISFQFRHGVSGWFAIENGQPVAEWTNRKCQLPALFPSVDVVVGYFVPAHQLLKLRAVGRGIQI